MPYGRCISVLLTGPPGTGKTMTAHVIANMLELPLFHADLSQITDKYIGETEKHLDAIFTEAEKSNCVLLLDEADAICGKRSEVSDSKDRYANNDTAFILQRLERYDGIVILATNFINNLDNAFMRRMKYILQFSLPSAAVRREIWESCFTEEMPVAEPIDFDYLAEQFQFAGANIKNVVLASAFLAASEESAITMRHILKSVGNEYLKFQKHALAGEFGKYSDLYRRILEEREG
ncbi:MAG: ATP-binding protein [Ruminococcus sp.]|nr:ATP-binding protein [Ruminococcus sp.]